MRHSLHTAWLLGVLLTLTPALAPAQSPPEPSTPVVSPTPTAQPAQAGAAATLPRIRVGLLAFLALQAGDLQAVDSLFVIKRSYINVEADLLPFLSARITPDTYADDDGIELRLKYAYAQLRAEGNQVVTRPTIQFGMVPTPWFGFEEQVNRFRMQDAMFIERSGLLDSADTGVTVSGLFGGVLPEAVRGSSAAHHPGRFGSFAFGVYNGGGYTARELNDNKVFEARVTGRPLPASLAGLQVSYYGVHGRGNREAAPDWRDQVLAVSWEHPRLAVAVQGVSGRGNQSGSYADPGTAEAWPHEGWSAFAEGRLGAHWSVIGRFDDFTSDTRTAGTRFRRVIGGLARHLGRGNTLLLDIDSKAWVDSTRPTETRYQLTLQVAY